MDLVSGLTAARLAIDLAKDLREIDKSVDEATFKLKLADLTSALADTQVALSDAKLRISELEEALKNRFSGDLCPKCKEGRLQVVSVEAAGYGQNEWHYSVCDSETCDYSNNRWFDTASNKYEAY
ncbi:hypothetical protein [Roseovarius sp.]|uniref:hypothetical protein n=1 Tax=Roseovarius sp. TaxID=1486281 RepID=UPI003D0D3193